MLSTFIMTFDGSQVSRDKVIQLLDGIPEIKNWSAFLPDAIALVSDLEARSITEIINTRRETKFRYVLVKATERGGWLPKDIWDFVKTPKSVV